MRGSQSLGIAFDLSVQLPIAVNGAEDKHQSADGPVGPSLEPVYGSKAGPDDAEVGEQSQQDASFDVDVVFDACYTKTYEQVNKAAHEESDTGTCDAPPLVAQYDGRDEESVGERLDEQVSTRVTAGEGHEGWW